MTRRTGMRSLRIAMVGQKGIPARYGGVETHVENIACGCGARSRRHRICRARCAQNARHQRDLSRRPPVVPSSVTTKHFDAASHTFLSA
jgi:hypothetical protein